jgi:hypothetical protein
MEYTLEYIYYYNYYTLFENSCRNFIETPQTEDFLEGSVDIG